MSGLVDNLYRRIRHREAHLICDSEARAGDFARLADHHYCLVATYRKNGQAVPTPLWFVIDGSTMYFRTAADALKIKRIQANPSVTIAACNARGRPTTPVEALAGIARILEGEEILAAETLLHAKYGRRRAMYSGVFGGPWEYVVVSPVAPLPSLMVGDAYQAAVEIALAATELEEVLGRIQATHPSRQMAAAVDEELAELRVYALAPQLLAPTKKRFAERVKLIEQLDRSVPLVQRIRRCAAWYDDGVMESKDGQRALALGKTIHSDSLHLPSSMRALEIQTPRPAGALAESPLGG